MDSHDATKAQVPSSSEAPLYWWYSGDSVKALLAKLMASNLDTAVLKCRIDGDKLMLSVFDDRQTAAGWVVADNDEINDSHVCPPNVGCL